MYSIVQCNPNGTGKTPHQAQDAFLRLVNDQPLIDQFVTVCGYGDHTEKPRNGNYRVGLIYIRVKQLLTIIKFIMITWLIQKREIQVVQ